MSPRELLLLSPYRLPAQHSLMLSHEESAAFLNANAALWHPAALCGAAAPPSVASPYDHEMPAAGCLYAVPESPPLVLPDDWDERVRTAGAAAFRASADRDTTLANLKDALRRLAAAVAETSRQGDKETGRQGDRETRRQGDGETDPVGPDGEAVAARTNGVRATNAASPVAACEWQGLIDLEREHAATFFGVGFGHLQLAALCEAMEHDNALAAEDFWQDVQNAVAAVARGDHDAARENLRAGAERMLAAREVLYPTPVHLIDLALLDDLPAAGLPASVAKEQALNLVASASLLERIAREQPDRLAAIRADIEAERIEVCGGCYLEREEPLLPVESQLWNLRKGLAVSRELLGSDVRVFARKRFAAHPQLPLFLNTVGLQRALLLAFDEAALPSYETPVVNWPSPDGKVVEAFTRAPYPADNAQTGFHVAHYLHKTIMQDHVATFALLHRKEPPGPWYEDWLELSRLAPVLGQWTTFSRYFSDTYAGEQVTAPSADEFHADYLSPRVDAHDEHPVTGLARQHRLRRRVDTAWTLLAMDRGLTGRSDLQALEPRLSALEDQVEEGTHPVAELLDWQTEAAAALSGRLLARAAGDQPGYLILNPCSFTRRLAIELQEAAGPWPITGPVKACQLDEGQSRLVVEVPGLGFAWLPRKGPPGTAMPALRMRLADNRHVRNEFLEAEIDPATGGLRGLWDRRTQVSRLGQQLVFNPGSSMQASEIKVTSVGPALGEVVTEGAILDEQEKVLAKFRQRFRAWLGRPVLEMRIEVFPEQQPDGYPWHSYYGARFAWRDERALLMRGVNGTGYATAQTRPETPDYLEVRQGRQNTVIFPGGLPFHQRHGARMVDVVLVTPGETARSFDLAVGLDREQPMQTAVGMVTPTVLVPTDKGPPHVGPSGWLFHLDAANLLLTGLRPGPAGADEIRARLLECGFLSGQAEFRCVRNPRRAVLLDARGEALMEATTEADAAVFEVSQGDFVQLGVEFG
jgi:hypothetical protein